MAKSDMMHSKPRLLLNAEPFGFGPAAAIASFAPLLQKSGMQISFIGEEHTLDLQRNLTYKAVYDTTNMTSSEKRNLISILSSEHDLFVTAMDFNMAEMAEEAGIRTIIYDALTWYWPDLHPAIKNADLYIAQEFFGVRERLANESTDLPDYKLVPPIVSVGKHVEKRHILLNMGGLQNPYWDFRDTVAYARLMLSAVTAAIPENETLVVTTSSKIAEFLNDPRVVTLSRQSMIDILKEARFAIMTPGLGNIYDAASLDVPTLWLPPANDSQGRQFKLLMENGCCDEGIDWSDLTERIDYKASQTTVVQEITNALQLIAGNETLKRKLSALATEKLHILSTCKDSKAKNLLQLFGSNGASDICEAIVKHTGSKTYASTK